MKTKAKSADSESSVKLIARNVKLKVDNAKPKTERAITKKGVGSLDFVVLRAVYDLVQSIDNNQK